MLTPNSHRARHNQNQVTSGSRLAAAPSSRPRNQAAQGGPEAAAPPASGPISDHYSLPVASGGQHRAARARRLTRYLDSLEAAGESQAEVVAFCRNIQNPQVLRDAIKGFRGHQVSYFVIDSCKVPPFPNDLFSGIDVRWLEMSNSTVQFHNNFLHARSVRSQRTR